MNFADWTDLAIIPSFSTMKDDLQKPEFSKKHFLYRPVFVKEVINVLSITMLNLWEFETVC